MLEKLLTTTCLALLVTAMSAINDEFRDRLIALASGGIPEKGSELLASATRWTNTMMENVAWYGGDHNGLLLTALGGAVIGAAWMMKW